MGKNEIIFISIILLFATYGGIENYFILKEDTVPFAYDLLNSYLVSTIYYNDIKNGNLSDFLTNYYNYNLVYPPLIVFQPIPFYFILGINEDTAGFSNIIHIFILLFSTYFIGKKIKNSHFGLMSAIILLFLPGMKAFSRVYLPDYALASFVTLSLAFLLYSNYFKNRFFMVLIGISSGLGMLTKWTFVIYFGPFVFIYLVKYLLLTKKKIHVLTSKNQIENIILLIIVFLIIISMWYLKNFNTVIDMLVKSDTYTRAKHFSGLNIFQTWFFIGKHYLFYLYTVLLKIYFIPIIIATIYVIKKFSVTKRKKLLSPVDLMLGTLIGILPFFNYIPATSRYLLPYMPIFSIILCVLLFDFFIIVYKRYLKKYVSKTTAYFVFLMILLITISAYDTYLKFGEKGSFNQSIGSLYASGIITPKEGFVVHKTIINYIKDLAKIHQKILVLQSSETMYIVVENLRLENVYFINNPVFCLTINQDIDIYGRCEIPKNLTSDFICNHDLVIDSDIYLPNISIEIMQKKFPERYSVMNKIISLWDKCKNQYKLNTTINNIPFDDKINSTIFIYVKI